MEGLVSVKELEALLQYVFHVTAEHDFAKGNRIVPDAQRVHSVVDIAMRGLVFGEHQPDRLSVYHKLATAIFRGVREQQPQEAILRTTAASYIQAIGNLREDSEYLVQALTICPEADSLIKKPDAELKMLPLREQVCLSYVLEDVGQFNRASRLADVPQMRMRKQGLEIMATLYERAGGA